MKYLLPTKNLGYIPDVMHYLDGIPDDNLFHDNYDLMHPMDIFSSVFNEVVENGLLLTEDLLKIIEVEKTRNKADEELIKSFKIKTKAFLFSLAGYIDGCQSIIKSTYENNSKEHKKANKEFITNITSYKNQVGKVVNYIKHRHRTVRIIFGRWDNQVIVGYYIEGVVEKGVIGPDPDIHLGSNCAISLNRDIPYHICNIYFLSAALKSIMSRSIKAENRNYKAETESQNNKIVTLLKLASKIPKNYFPDEIKKSVPDIRIKNNSKLTFELTFPSRYSAINKKPHILNLSLETAARSRSPTIKTPYFGNDTHHK